MSDIRFKSIEESDLPGALEIYNHYIQTTTANFYYEPISIEQLKGFVFLNHGRYKAYMIYRQDDLVGFCFTTQFKNREAYNRTAEIGIYLNPEHTGRGLGVAVVKHLEKVSEDSGIKMLIASISGENVASIRLFEKLDYQKCGHIKRIGEKHGKVLDVVFFQKSLE